MLSGSKFKQVGHSPIDAVVYGRLSVHLDRQQTVFLCLNPTARRGESHSIGR